MSRNMSAVLSRDLGKAMPSIHHASGIYYYTDSGRRIIDACGGSAVSCLGHGNARVIAAIRKQVESVPYCHSQFFTTTASEKLATKLVNSTNGAMARLLTLSSGSESLEAALKMARQYYLELPEPQESRSHFISRLPSYHGATLMSLGVGGHVARRAIFEPMLAVSSTKVSQCNAYRGMRPEESSQDYVRRLATELDDTFRSLPEKSVAAFIAETVTGASTGSVPAPEGYFAAMKEVCEAHGALLILDEVMCGMGRTGTMHAWQREGVAPDIQVIGKAFGGGYVPISGILINHKIDNVLKNGSGKFSHGQSFQCHPMACAAALEVQNVIDEDNLLENVNQMGKRLADGLHAKLGAHPHVGDIRGRGLFWSIELVKDKMNKEPFSPVHNVGYSFHDFALQDGYDICVYPGHGTIDGRQGDHFLLAPAYTITPEEVDLIVEKVSDALFDYFGKHFGRQGAAEFRQW